MTQSWFLRRRITLAFGLTTFLLSLALSLPFGWIVRTSIQEEIEALVREEIEETKAHCAEHMPTPAEFTDMAADMQRDHRQNPLAFRLWRAGETSPYCETGPSALLAHMPLEPSLSQDTRALDEALRFTRIHLDDGSTLELMLDATVQVERFWRALWSAFGFVLLATAVATLAGRLIGLRISRLLAEVAASAATGDESGLAPGPGTAPEEIQAVVRALQDTLRRIRAQSENARLLASGLAHELRSPLQNLMGEIQVALLRERDPGEYQRVLESQLEDLGELSRVVDNLVSLSSAEELLRRRSVEHFDLAEEARLRLARERRLAERRGVELVFAAEGELSVVGDREALLLALRNVVTNAIEWSPPGKSVEVCMRAGAEGLEIVVDDAGPGVPHGEREKIFRPFHRGPAAKGRRVGFGLGLALTHSAVRAQGGRIEVGDSPAGGARFRILLPTGGEKSAKESARPEMVQPH